MKLLLVPVILVLLSSVMARKKICLSCKCGWTNSGEGRVVRGAETLPNEFPWMVSLQLYDSHFCGASIITSWHVLTAAHCLWGKWYQTYHIKLVLGAHNVSITNDRSVKVRIATIVLHAGFTNEAEMSYDIALLVTPTKIPFSNVIGPVCMPTSPLFLHGKFIKQTGWGNTQPEGSPSDVLLEVDLKVIPEDICLNHWCCLQQKVCTKSPMKGSCQGDSGSPLIWLDPDTSRYTQVALVSYGFECAGPDPSVNTDVATYIDWINRYIESTKPGVHVCRKVYSQGCTNL